MKEFCNPGIDLGKLFFFKHLYLSIVICLIFIFIKLCISILICGKAYPK